jgi:hypothetical protein
VIAIAESGKTEAGREHGKCPSLMDRDERPVTDTKQAYSSWSFILTLLGFKRIICIESVRLSESRLHAVAPLVGLS